MTRPTTLAISLAAALTLTACAPHTDTAATAQNHGTVGLAAIGPTKPPRPIGKPETLRPGLNTWTNPDGTVGAVFNDERMRP